MRKRKLMMTALSLLVAGAGLYACGGFEEEDNPVSPQGNVPKVYAVSGCKSFARPDGTRGSLDDECVEYKALADGYLSINHVNAAFVCGATSINTTVSIEDGVIVVREHASYDPTMVYDCICFYDLYSEIGPLEKRNYTVVFLWRYSDDVKFQFDIQYDDSLSGTYMVNNKYEEED
jgi:hypothetical protein